MDRASGGKTDPNGGGTDPSGGGTDPSVGLLPLTPLAAAAMQGRANVVRSYPALLLLLLLLLLLRPASTSFNPKP